MRIALVISLVTCFMCVTFYLHAQDGFQFTRGFSKKIQRAGITFYEPVEDWLNPTKLKKDEFLKYDLVLKSRQSYEMRMIIKRDQKHRISHPHIQIATMLSSIATNDPSIQIEVELFSQEFLGEYYCADWGMAANFSPKQSFASFSKGRLLSLFKGGKALISCIILYDGELTEYHNRPFSFM